MKISGELKNGVLALSLHGELDHHGAKEVMSEAGSKIEDLLPRECLLDFKNVSFMDSSGVALILNVNKRMNNIGGRLRVENVARQPMKVIDASGIERIIDIKETEQ